MTEPGFLFEYEGHEAGDNRLMRYRTAEGVKTYFLDGPHEDGSYSLIPVVHDDVIVARFNAQLAAGSLEEPVPSPELDELLADLTSDGPGD